MNRKVSIIIPTIRPDNIPQLERWIIERAGVDKADLEILTMEDTERIGTPKMVKTMVQIARHDLVMYLGDDCEPEQNFVLAALSAMKKFEGNWGLVGLNCGRWSDTDGVWTSFLDHSQVSQHWLAHKRLLKHLDGEFFHTGYQHCFCDNELTRRCIELKRYRFAKKARIIHHHPIVMQDESLWDEDLKRVYSDEVYTVDRRLLELRSNNRWKTPKKMEIGANFNLVPILVPNYGQGKHRFWTCLSRLQAKSMQNGISTFFLKKSTADIAHSRNLLTSDALRRFPQAQKFLFLDNDMTFPSDLLLRLLAHNKDIVTVNAYRKGAGYFPVVSIQGKDDEYFRPVHIKPEEGALRRVTSAGTGAVLIDRKVFETMTFPWFKSEYVDPVGEDMDSANIVEGKMFVSEDNRFYIITTSLGFKLYCDFSIPIGHIGDYEFTWEDHERYLRENPELTEVKNGERNQIDDENAGPGDSGNRDQQHDQPRIAGRLQAPAGVA